MHPVLTRYLNLEAALDTLARDAQGHPLRAEERAFAAAARAAPEHRDTLEAARGQPFASPEVQEALLVLAARAAGAALAEDVEFAAQIEAARGALAAQGGSEEQLQALLASIVAEEGFGDDGDVDTFDRVAVSETLQEIPALAGLTLEQVEELRDTFAQQGEPSWQQAHAVAAGCLLQAAWGTGPTPVTPEHIQEALDGLRERLGESEAARGVEAMRRFTAFLETRALVGPLRRARLDAALRDYALTLDSAQA